MDPKQVRKTIDNLLADLVRNPSLGRPQSFMGRFGRPLALGVALGVGSVAGCSSGSDNRDALPGSVDGYGGTAGVVIRSEVPDGASADTRDALPGTVDIYGATVDSLNPPPDSADGATADTRDALPLVGDAYGIVIVPLRVDTADTISPVVDGSPVDSSPVDADN